MDEDTKSLKRTQQLITDDEYARLSKSLSGVCQMVADVMYEIGCPCIAHRLCGDESWTALMGEPAWLNTSTRYPLISLMPKLVPLAHGLEEAGYYDTALACAEVAGKCEPTVELDLARAFLYLVLGDTEEAAYLYAKVHLILGSLPPDAVAKLRKLALTHAEEDDIRELYHALVQHQAA